MGDRLLLSRLEFVECLSTQAWLKMHENGGKGKVRVNGHRQRIIGGPRKKKEEMHMSLPRAKAQSDSSTRQISAPTLFLETQYLITRHSAFCHYY